MATIVLSAVGASIGSGFGGAVFGLSGAVIGRAAGATLGRVIDQRLLGGGSEPVETGKVDRFRLTGASEGAPIGRVFGRARVGGQIIWASRFQENVTATGGGKGAAQPKTNEYSYSVSLAVALCEGEITRVGRVWADGIEMPRDMLQMRVYTGTETQLPDPKISAVEGADKTPSYRGTAYVVLEDLDLAPFGNRVPQFSFEVVRPAQGAFQDSVPDLTRGVRAVAMIPGTGEYALATTPVHYSDGPGLNRSANVNSPSGKTDMATSLEMLREELPDCGSVSLVVSWFGDDLRCGECQIRPLVEQDTSDGVGMPWSVAGLSRATAGLVPQNNGRPVYGGSPDDRSVIEAIKAIRDGGQKVMIYPFILMTQQAGNGLTNPWDGAVDQPVMPWRGRITLSVAPARPGSPDRSAAAEAEVAAFFGSAVPGDFAVSDGSVTYSGPAEWGFRRFILHHAALAAAAGGADAFCIGSEMRGLTQIRGANDSFPAVEALRVLASDVRQILGPECKLTYAADWSEYFGYDAGEGNRYFHLDPLWADPEIDAVGIDNYMPLSDWRDGTEHADAEWESIYNIDYLQANVGGGEGYDWYYPSANAAEVQLRSPITDGAYGEPWVWRYKDLKGWWSNHHHERLGGIRQENPTGWLPQSKPIWFTEMGCAALDKATNQPNKFLDLLSSESTLPNYSDGTRDDLIQMQYLRAMYRYWGDTANNPVSTAYDAPMVDMSRAHVWAWDARPFPQFPNNETLWADGASYRRGHWINGRTSGQPLASVVAEICEKAGLTAFDVSRLHGYVRGYVVDDVSSARAALQPLMMVYGFEAVERHGLLVFKMRDQRVTAEIDPGALALLGSEAPAIETTRSPDAEIVGRVRVAYVQAEGDYEVAASEAVFPDDAVQVVSKSEVPLALTGGEGQGLAERWLAEARVARDTMRFALPPSQFDLGAGDLVRVSGRGDSSLYRIDTVEMGEAQQVDAVRTEPTVYRKSDDAEARVTPRAFVPPVPTFPVFLDLPLLNGDEDPVAPHLGVAVKPWPGLIAAFDASDDAGYEFNSYVVRPARVGLTETELPQAAAGRWDNGPALRVRMFHGGMSSASEVAVLNGANVLAIGDGSPGNWEIVQFAEATLVETGVYEIRRRLRGQLGSDALIPVNWPVGSLVVVLDRAVDKIKFPSALLGLDRHFRIGPALRPMSDPSYVHRIERFAGVGLRPYAPAHLTCVRDGGDLRVTWVRRTRVGGDNWDLADVPLAEAFERYHVKVTAAGTVLREATVANPSWTYSAAAQAGDGASGVLRLEVAQVSDLFGPGLYRSCDVVL